MRFEIPANLREIEPLLVRIHADLHSRSGREWKRVELAVTEALSNAILHGSPRGNDDRIQVEWESTPERLEIRITDTSHFQPLPRGHRLPDDPLSEQGRGLYLIAELMNDVRHDLVDGKHRITLEKIWPKS